VWRSHFGLLSGFIFVVLWPLVGRTVNVVGEADVRLPIDFVQSIHSIRFRFGPQWQSIQSKWVTGKVFILLGLCWTKEREPGDFAAQTLSFLYLHYIRLVKRLAISPRAIAYGPINR